ncbi:unnamed protein product [Cuscuta europaea]|uniref:Uncharacterized protein n=1 Tax=Cuscuta europaea TaxID=41803 RepID=A0A9P1EEL3_CUSEU|nr:unnamed protein product [Cuscuta europaea]
MDVASFAAMKRHLGKAQTQKKKGSGGGGGGQKPVEAFYKKGGEEPSTAVADAGEVGGSQAVVASKKKKAGKAVESSAKRQKAADSDKQPATNDVVILDAPAGQTPIAQEVVNEAFFRREKLEAIMPKGSSVLEATLCPSTFLSQVLPSGDRMALSRLDDSALKSKILLSSASVSHSSFSCSLAFVIA